MNPEIIERMITDGRDSYEARLAAGQARLKQGETALAIAHLEKAVALKPDQSVAWQVLGQAFLNSEDPNGARAAWTQGIAVASQRGDQQAEKVMRVWLRRLDKTTG